MKTLLDFTKTTLTGGLIVLLPILLFMLILSEILDLVVALGEPMSVILPSRVVRAIKDPLPVAIVLLVVASFLCGLALRSRHMKNWGIRFEENVLNRIPIYKSVKKLSRGLMGVKGEGAFTCAVMTLTPGVEELVYVVEDTGNGRLTVLTPLAPTGLNGPLRIVDAERVRPIPGSMGEATGIIGEWGVGLARFTRAASSDQPETGQS